MGNLFTRSGFLRFCAKAAGIALALTLLFWYTVDLWAERKLPFIETTLSAAIHRPVIVQSARYNLFFGFLLDGVEIKQHAPMFSPIRIERVRIVPAFQLFPEPAICIRELFFEEPLFSVKARPEDIFHAAVLLKNLPADCGQIGALKVQVKLSAAGVSRGKISLLSPGKDRAQDFENVEFFAGQSFFKKNFVSLKGHIAGKPEATFEIECNTTNSLPEALDLNLRMDFRHFTTAYLNRHLEDRFRVPGDQLTASIRLKIHDGRRFEVRGRIAPPEITAMRFSARGFWRNDKATFVDLSLESGGIELKGKGDALLSKNSGHYQFLLFSPWFSFDKLKDFIRPLVPGTGRAQFSVVLEGDARHFEPLMDMVFEDCAFNDLNDNISVTKIGGRLKLSKKDLEALDIWAFVNNLPVRVNAKVHLAKKRRFTFEVTTYPGQVSSLRSRNPFNVSLKGSGVNLKKGWSGTVRLEEDFLSADHRKNVSTLSFHGLFLDRGKKHFADWWRKTRGSCEALQWRRQAVDRKGSAVDFSLKRLRFLFSTDRRSLRVQIFNALFNGENVRFRIGARFAGPACGISASIRDADVSRLLRYVRTDYPVTGLLSAKAFWKWAHQASQCRVQFKVSNGRIGPSSQLAYWAEQTGVEALQRIYFQLLSGEADYDKGEWQLKNFRLSGDSVRLAADMKFGEKNIAGFFSVKFPASSIRDSSNLKWLLHFVGAGDWVDFDFKVAGHVLSPRIQWLEGEFKKKVESRLAPWMKNELARQIEKRLAAQSGLTPGGG